MMRQKFRSCLEVFRRNIYPDGQRSAMCDIHKSFGSLDGCLHNCLGCNFADATGWIYKFLSRCDQFDDVSETFTDFIIKLYLLVERIYVIFEIIKLPEEVRGRRFRILQAVHKWANFLKHPDSFMLVHHARHFFEGMVGFDRSQFAVIIDQEFVNEFYSGKENKRKLFEILKNNISVAVLFPEPEKLTEDFCVALCEFVKLVDQNAVYREVLSVRSSYENYFCASSAK